MQITWYGHSAFRLDFAGQADLIDPFFTGNPAFVSDTAAAIDDVGHVVLTHGHSDHVGDALDIARGDGATTTTNYDLGMWSVSAGLEKLNPNTGGTTDLGGGIIIKAAGESTVYHLGDTDIFSDMALIAEIHQPTIAMVPIGDRFTMSPNESDHGRARGEALLKARGGHSLSLWLVPDRRGERRQMRRRNERARDEGPRAGKG
jgi:L-ascorbate metabolism protein UlaG (beta-lactamase superfamily)